MQLKSSIKINSTTYLQSYVLFLLNLGKRLETEKVPNIFLTLFNVYPKIKGNLTPQAKKDFQTVLRKAK